MEPNPDLVRLIGVDQDIVERALDALLAAEGERFDPDVPPSPELDARIVAAIRAAEQGYFTGP